MGELVKFVTLSFHELECYQCGVWFCMTDEQYNTAKRDKREFFCPNGHGQIFTGKTDKEKLDEANKLLAQEKQKRLWAENEVNKVKTTLKRHKKRAANGVCPCCNRSFVQLARHMKSKHPDYEK